MRLRTLYILLLFTYGLYSAVWVHRFARDLGQAGRVRKAPWVYVLGILLPGINLVVFYRLARHVTALAEDVNLRTTLRPGELVLLQVLFGLLYAVLEQTGYYLALVIVLSVTPLPWLALQRDLNRIKSRHPDWTWRIPRFRLAWAHYAFLGLMLLATVPLGIGVYEEWTWYQGERLPRGQIYSPSGGLYAITAPDPDWSRIPAGTNGDADSDSELSHRDLEGFVVAYVQRDTDLDSTVRNRFHAMNEDGLRVFKETRRLQPGELVPVSVAHYAGVDGGRTVDWWVATAQLGNDTVEVIGAASRTARSRHSMRTLVHSTRFMLPGPGTR